jgi:hypothetical protein
MHMGMQDASDCARASEAVKARKDKRAACMLDEYRNRDRPVAVMYRKANVGVDGADQEAGQPGRTFFVGSFCSAVATVGPLLVKGSKSCCRRTVGSPKTVRTRFDVESGRDSSNGKSKFGLEELIVAG